MKQRILLALALVVMFAAPAFASVQNVKLSGFIDSTYLWRDRFDFSGRQLAPTASNDQYQQSVFITQTGLRVDADLSDNVSTTIALLNERAWGEENQDAKGDQTDIDLYKAYVTLKEMLYSPLTVVIGRQNFNYGNAFIIGSIGPNNSTLADSGLFGVAGDMTVRTSYDGIKAILDYNPLTVDVFAAKLDANNLNGGSGPKVDDIDLYGINANYKLGDDMNTVVEGYFFAKIDNSTEIFTAASPNAKAETVYVPGLHASTNPIKGLMVSGEVAWQGGTEVTSLSATPSNLKREAMGAQAIVTYALPFEETAKWNPVISTVYSYTSGDHNTYTNDDLTGTGQASSEKWTAWDPMLENQSGGKIYNSFYNLTNSHIVEIAAQVNPIEDVTTKLTWTGLWLDKDLTGAISQTAKSAGIGACTLVTCPRILPDGTTVLDTVTSNTNLGHELDADISYAYTEDVSIGLSLGWFMPGNAYDSANNENARQAIAHVGVVF